MIGPNGDLLAGPLEDGVEGIVYADIDLEKSLDGKLFHDIAGNYNRFDVLSLNLNQRVRQPLLSDRAMGVENKVST
ncbi:Aliphatic nitrilase [Castellaniella defragrans]